MAVYTPVTRAALDRFLQSYDLGAVTRFDGITAGVENTNYRLHTATGRYILTLFEKRVQTDDLPYFIALMRHAADKHVPAPFPMADHNGQILKTLQHKPALIVSECAGTPLDAWSPDHLKQVGTCLATFHQAGADFHARRANALALAGWRALIDAAAARTDGMDSALGAELQQEFAYLDHHWPRHLPQGTLHADLFPDNVLWQDNAITGVIDFYFACTDTLAYDLAIALNAWCFDTHHRFQPRFAQSLIAGYESVRPLNHAEHDALPLLCRGAALRFLLTRLNDQLFPPAGALVTPKDPQEYVQKNRFFRTFSPAAA